MNMQGEIFSGRGGAVGRTLNLRKEASTLAAIPIFLSQAYPF